MRNMERLLDNNIENPLQIMADIQSGKHVAKQTSLSLEDTGRLLIVLNKLKYYSAGLPLEYRKMFLEDLGDIETEESNLFRQMMIIARMYRNFPFLGIRPT